jgi:hypothetical protein
MFFNLLEDKEIRITRTFPDVPAGHWYTEAVHSLASIGIVEGYQDGSFRPDAFITRAEFVTMTARFAGLAAEQGGNARFPDVAEAHWAYRYINTAAGSGWIEGYSSGLFEPDRYIVRAEAVKIVNRALERCPDKAFIDAREELAKFLDVDSRHWAFYEIMEAYHTHDFIRKDDGSEEWTDSRF